MSEAVELVPAAIAHEVEAGRKASNLAFALIVLPRDRRADAMEFYRFCRILDDIADSPTLSIAEKACALDAWERAIAGPLPAPLEAVVHRHAIDRALLHEILAGVRMDLTTTRYETFTDVRRYCWRVASAVGLVSIRVFGCTDPASARYAENLGLALQWTNILRDVGEDAANGRIYLPREELAEFDVNEEALLAGQASGRFGALMKFQAERAARFFAGAVVPPRDRRALRAAEVMRAIYGTLLRRIQADGFRVLERRYRLTRAEKVLIAFHSLAGLRRG